MKKEGISCKKYNNSIEKDLSYENYHTILKLNWEETDLTVFNYYPNYNHIKSSLAMLPKLDYNSGMFETHDVLKMKEDILKVSSIGHQEKKCKASLKLSEITGFTYGGVNSRFWKSRKYINNLDR